MELFKIVIPELAVRYEQVFKLYKNNALHRFKDLFENSYSTAIKGNLQTLINSKQCLEYMNISCNYEYKNNDMEMQN